VSSTTRWSAATHRRPPDRASRLKLVIHIVVLRVDPAATSLAFVLLGGSDFKTLLFGGDEDSCAHIFEEQRVVVLVHLTWL
jgi:hypothetical protein